MPPLTPHRLLSVLLRCFCQGKYSLKYGESGWEGQEGPRPVAGSLKTGKTWSNVKEGCGCLLVRKLLASGEGTYCIQTLNGEVRGEALWTGLLRCVTVFDLQGLTVSPFGHKCLCSVYWKITLIHCCRWRIHCCLSVPISKIPNVIMTIMCLTYRSVVSALTRCTQTEVVRTITIYTWPLTWLLWILLWWWKDMSMLGLQEEVKYLLLNQQRELGRNGQPVLYRNLFTRSQKKQENPN